MNVAQNWLAAAALALLMSAAWHLDGPTDHQADWSASTELKELQASAKQAANLENAAIELCTKERGAGAAVLWTADGSLVCRARVVRVAGGGL